VYALTTKIFSGYYYIKYILQNKIYFDC